MEKIKLTGSDQLYEIQSIRPTSEHVLQIIFADAVPVSWDGDIQIYTAGGILATTLGMDYGIQRGRSDGLSVS